VTHVLESLKGQPVRELEQLTLEVRRDIDVEYMKRAKDFLKRSTEAGKPFLLYFNHSMLHLPTIPRAEFKGKTGHGDWADSHWPLLMVLRTPKLEKPHPSGL
jgi:hypothetical protein